MEDNNKKTFSETIKELREQNQNQILNEEKTRTTLFQRNMEGLYNKFSESVGSVKMTDAGSNIEKNIVTVTESLKELPNISREDNKALKETLDTLTKSILDSSDVNGEEQERLLQMISETKSAIQTSSIVQKETLLKIGENIVDTSINTTAGLAGLVSGNNPLVMMLTKTLLEGTKNSAVQLKEWNKRRKERKEESKRRQNEFLQNLEVQEKIAKNSDETVKAQETSETVKPQESTDRKDVVDNDTSGNDIMGDDAIAELYSESMESFNSAIDNLNDLSETLETHESSETLKTQESSKTPENSVANATLLPQENPNNLSNFTQDVSDKETHDLISRLIQIQEKENETRLIKDAEDLETKKEEKDFQTKLLTALDKDEEISVSEPKSMLGKILFGIAIAVTAFAVGFIDGLKDSLRVVRKIFSGWINKLKNSKLGKFVSNFIDKIKKGPIGTFFAKIKSFFGESKFVKKISSAIDKIKKFIKPVTKFFTKVKDFFANTFSKLSVLSEGDGIFSKIAKFAGKFGRFLGRLVLPVTVAIAAFDSIKGFIEGFKEEGLVGGIKGAITGLFDSLLGGLLNIIKDVAAWILNLFGFENAAEKLKEFDFTEMFSNMIEKVFGVIESLVDKVTEMFSLDSIQNMLPDWAKNWFSSDDETTPTTKLGQPKSNMDILEDSKAWYRYDGKIEKIQEAQNKMNEAKNKIKAAKTAEESQRYLKDFETAKSEFESFLSQAVEAKYVKSASANMLVENVSAQSREMQLLHATNTNNFKVKESVQDLGLERTADTISSSYKYQETQQTKEELQEKALKNAAATMINAPSNTTVKSTTNNTGLAVSPVASLATFSGE